MNLFALMGTKPEVRFNFLSTVDCGQFDKKFHSSQSTAHFLKLHLLFPFSIGFNSENRKKIASLWACEAVKDVNFT